MSYSACCGKFPTSLVGLAYNSKSCLLERVAICTIEGKLFHSPIEEFPSPKAKTVFLPLKIIYPTPGKVISFFPSVWEESLPSMEYLLPSLSDVCRFSSFFLSSGEWEAFTLPIGATQIYQLRISVLSNKNIQRIKYLTSIWSKTSLSSLMDPKGSIRWTLKLLSIVVKNSP